MLTTGSQKANTNEFIGIADVAKNEAEVAPFMPHSGTVTSMYCRVSTAPGSGKEDKIVVLVNGAEQAAATCTISGTATTTSTLGITGVTFAEGQTLAAKTVAAQGGPLVVISLGLG
jgi:hypothetical protein